METPRWKLLAGTEVWTVTFRPRFSALQQLLPNGQKWNFLILLFVTLVLFNSKLNGTEMLSEVASHCINVAFLSPPMFVLDIQILFSAALRSWLNWELRSQVSFYGSFIRNKKELELNLGPVCWVTNFEWKNHWGKIRQEITQRQQQQQQRANTSVETKFGNFPNDLQRLWISRLRRGVINYSTAST